MLRSGWPGRRWGGRWPSAARVAVRVLLAVLTSMPPLAVAQAQTGWQTGTSVAPPAKAPEPPKEAKPAPAKPAPPSTVKPAKSVPPPALRPTAVVATSASVVGTEDRVRFTLALDRPIEAAVYTVADPYRVIVDLPDVEFRLPPEAGQGRTGLVSGFRYGVFQAGRSRIVLDTAGPVMIDRLSNGRSRAGGAEVAFDIVRIDRAEFQAIAAAEAARGTALRGTRPETSPAPKSAKSGRPVVVIDPGHGGLDPGTVAGADLTEKALVLSVGRQIRAAIAALGRIDVHLTRSDDVFVPLDERVRMARNLGADLFISLHADAIAEREYTGLVRGATIYTLSDRASDEVARRAAEKENASDILAGVEASAPGEEDHVRSILSDLLKRETSDFSSEIRNLLLDKLKGKVTLSKDPRRSAAFAVLRQAETPSVLMELGYLSNPEDRARMITPEWQRQVAAAVAAAVDQYFAKRPRVSNR